MALSKSSFPQKKAKLLIPRARLAMENEFFVESLWLVSLAVEARLRALIAKNDKMHPGAGYTLEQCLKRVKFLVLKLPDSSLSGSVSIDLIDELRTWKNQRNLVLKAIESSHVSKKRLSNLAVEGIELMERLNNAYKKYKSEWKRSLVKVPMREKGEGSI
jgi:hypothetical protein